MIYQIRHGLCWSLTCLAEKGPEVVLQKIIGFLLMPFFELFAQARHGVIYLLI
jgi:hypothetical protein